MRTRLVLAALPFALVAVAVAPSSAAPKPVGKTYTATANPDPSPNASGACARSLVGGEHSEPFKATTAGKLAVDMSGFQGDWDLCVFDKAGKLLASSAGFEVTTEATSLKLKKPTELVIVAQNLVGGPTATVTYLFTPST